MEVVDLKEVKEGGLIALVRGTIKVVLLFARHLVGRALFCVASSRASRHLRSLARFPVDFNGRVRQWCLDFGKCHGLDSPISFYYIIVSR